MTSPKSQNSGFASRRLLSRAPKMTAVALVIALSAGCANAGMGDKQAMGGLLGGVGGAVAGSQFGQGKGQLVGVAAGTLLGAVLGSEVGRSLDRADQIALNRTTLDALEKAPSGKPRHWSNPDNGHKGTITPRAAYKNSAGRYCREFQQTVVIGGVARNAYGTACRMGDGQWKIVNDEVAAAPNQPRHTAYKPHQAPHRRY